MNLQSPVPDTLKPEHVYYIYAVTPKDASVSYPQKGIYESRPIEKVVFNNVQALVSEVPFEQFNRDYLTEKMAEQDWLEESVRRHTRIVNGIHSECGIIPMRFLTLCKDLQEVKAFLVRHETDLNHALESVSGTYEWGVKVYCDIKKLQELVLEQNAQIKQLDRRISKLQEGTSFLLRKKKTRLAKETLARICMQCKDECYSKLKALASEVEEVAIQSGEISGYAGAMIFNSAFLVSNDRATDFQEVVSELAQQYKAQGFDVVQSGPWPPYHFVKKIT